jgi:hypothetical protein
MMTSFVSHQIASSSVGWGARDWTEEAVSAMVPLAFVVGEDGDRTQRKG